MTTKRSRLGLFGGTFDPIHLGHIMMAEDALRAANLDQIIFLPAYSSPLREKDSETPAADRLDMVRLAVADYPQFSADDFDIRKGRRVYSAETVRYMREKHPNAELHFLIGFDQLAKLSQWREIDFLRHELTFICAQRGDEGINPADYGNGFFFLPPRRIDISSTEIRERSRKGESVRSLIPKLVAEYLEDEPLYRRG